MGAALGGDFCRARRFDAGSILLEPSYDWTSDSLFCYAILLLTLVRDDYRVYWSPPFDDEPNAATFRGVFGFEF